ncbi:MAG TPA: hypothetical protein VIO16_12890, partial [Dehalococcoidia bacterium]
VKGQTQMEPSINVDEAPDRQLIERRIQSVKAKLAIEQDLSKEKKTYLLETYVEELENLEFKLASLPRGVAEANQRNTLLALDIDFRRSAMLDQASVIEHRKNIEDLWRSHDAAMVDALNRNTEALLAIAKSLQSRT